MKISLHGNSAVPYCSAPHEAPAVSQRDPVEYHPSRQSKLLLTSAKEVPCGFCHYSATTENSNHQQMTTASLFATMPRNIHNWTSQPPVEVIARIGGTAIH